MITEKGSHLLGSKGNDGVRLEQRSTRASGVLDDYNDELSSAKAQAPESVANVLMVDPRTTMAA